MGLGNGWGLLLCLDHDHAADDQLAMPSLKHAAAGQRACANPPNEAAANSDVCWGSSSLAGTGWVDLMK